MTSVSMVTPAGRGAVATLVVRGDLPIIDELPQLFQSASKRPVAALPLGRVTFGRWGDLPGEEVVVCRTAEFALEIHCHGGEAAATRITHDLVTRGGIADEATPIYGDGDAHTLLDRECRDALSHATTLRTADILLQQRGELLRRTIESLEELDSAAAKRQVDETLRWAEFGVHLTQPWRVVLCGRPNVGKSSLINALLGFSRAIVFDQPGTTRDVVTTETALNGWPVVLSDTAGLRDQADELEAVGIERARRTIADADVRIVLIDTSTLPHADDQRLLAAWPDALVVAHKCDLPSAWDDATPPEALEVSSLTGAGVDTLADEIAVRLVPHVPAPMTPVPVTRRQVTLLEEIRQLIGTGVSADIVRRRIERLVDG